jgi:hypothetical protein
MGTLLKFYIIQKDYYNIKLFKPSNFQGKAVNAYIWRSIRPVLAFTGRIWGWIE